MSARDPHYCSPARARIIATATPEDTLCACAELGLTAKLHEPDLGTAPQFEVIATGDQTRALRKWKRGRYYATGEAGYAADYAAIKKNIREHGVCSVSVTTNHGPANHARAPRPRGGWGQSEYERRDEGERCHKFRCYAWNEIVIETCHQRSLRCERISVPAWDFVIMWVWADKREFSAARYIWLQKMIAAMPKIVASDKPEPVEEIDLFV